MNWYDKLKPVLKGLKWGVIAAVIASGWIMAAWIKADLKPSFGQLGQKSPPVFLEPLKPSSGQLWAFNECVPVQYLAQKEQPQKKGSSSTRSSRPGQPTGSSQTSSPPAVETGVQVLPLGKFLIPAAGRDPLYATPLLDSKTGKTTLKVEPAGGFARFGGERYAFMDFSYQKLLQSDFLLSDVPSLSIGIHQDLGRIGKMELMVEGWLQASLLTLPEDRQVELGVGGRMRLALPF